MKYVAQHLCSPPDGPTFSIALVTVFLSESIMSFYVRYIKNPDIMINKVF